MSSVALLIIIAILLNGCGNEKTKYDVSSTAVEINNLYNSSDISDDEKKSVVSDETANEEDASLEMDDAQEIADIKDAKSGDCVVLGKYEQDGDKGNGTEPIEWIVLDENEDNLLLISKYVIEEKPFNDTDKAVGWSGSTIRKWLNEDFIKMAFDDMQLEYIIETEIDNPGSKDYFKEFDKSIGIAGSKKTKDKVFLLSYEEVLKYYEPEKIDKFCVYVHKDLITSATPYSGIDNKCLLMNEYEAFYKEEGWPQDCVDISGSGWFLRSCGVNSNDVMSVGYDGAVRGQYLEYGEDYENVTFEGGVRPAMWVSKSIK